MGPASRVPARGVVTTEALREQLHRLAGTLPTERREEEMRRVLAALAAHDPASAIEMARQQIPTARRGEAHAAILKVWSQSAPEAAWRWVLANPEAAGSGQPGVVLMQVAGRDPALALRFAAELAAARPDRAEEAYASVFSVMMQAGDYTAALHAVRQIADPALQSTLTQPIVAHWAVYQPDAVIGWLRSISDPAARDRLMNNVTQSLAVTEPRRAAEIAVTIQTAETRRTALTDAVTAWFDANPAEATAWVDRFDPHPDLDGIAATIATMPAIVATRADVAVGWAESITEEKLRLRSLSTIVSAWAGRDRAAALRYVETSPALNGEERHELKRALGRL